MKKPMTVMKNNLAALVIGATLFSACQPQSAETNAIPEDLEGKQAMLQEKKKELQELTATINELEDGIAELDPKSTLNQGVVVRVSPLIRQDFSRYVEVQGQVEADDRVAATAEVTGRLLSVTVDEGDRVRQGQLLDTLDLEQVNKQMAEIQTSLDLARDVYNRQSRLWEQNIGSEIQYLEAKNNVERLEKSLETLEFQLTKSKVYAPISGVVDVVNLKGGELASPGAPIVTILNTGRLQVAADLPENYLQNISRGDQVKIEYPALNIKQTGRVSLIGSTIDPSNRTFKVEVNVSNPRGLLKPNLLAIMLVKDYEEEDVVVVPLNLVQQEVGGKNFVMVAEQRDGAAFVRKKYVTTGESYDGNIIVESGLSGTETIITEGARGLADGDPIRIREIKQEAANG
jgi:membrane fusion protein, multidrug efflux system